MKNCKVLRCLYPHYAFLVQQKCVVYRVFATNMKNVRCFVTYIHTMHLWFNRNVTFTYVLLQPFKIEIIVRCFAAYIHTMHLWFNRNVFLQLSCKAHEQCKVLRCLYPHSAFFVHQKFSFRLEFFCTK